MLSNLNFWSYLPKESTKSENSNDTLEKEDNNNINKDNLINTERAIEWGNYFLEVGKTAVKKTTSKVSKQVSSTAKQLRENVSQQSNIISKFSDEQTKFTEEKRLFEEKRRITCLPWMEVLHNDDNDNDEEEQQKIKKKIFSVSCDSRNFLRNPPAGSGFEFNYDLYSPVAQLLLEEDENLAEMRYNLVPKKIKEEIFWRNYFYRVFLIKQSLIQSNIKDDSVDNKDDFDDCSGKRELSKEEMVMLKNASVNIIGSKVGDDNEEWDAELQKELSEFELVNEDNHSDDLVIGGVEKEEYDDIEREILTELDKSIV